MSDDIGRVATRCITSNQVRPATIAIYGDGISSPIRDDKGEIGKRVSKPGKSVGERV